MIRLALRDDGALTQGNIPRVLKTKHDLFGQSGMVNLELDTAQFSDIAGIKNLRAPTHPT